MNLATKILFFLMVPSLAFSDDGTWAGNHFEDLELRTNYNFDSKGYESTFRLKFGNSKYKNQYLNFQIQNEKSKLDYLKAKSAVSKSYRLEQNKILLTWRADLIKSYNSYKKAVKANPSKVKFSIDIEVNELLAGGTVVNKGSILSAKEALSKEISELAFGKMTQAILANGQSEAKLSSLSLKSDRSLVRFLDLDFLSGDENETDVFDPVKVQVGLSIPFGFLGEKQRAKRKMALADYKVKSDYAQREQALLNLYEQYKTTLNLYKMFKPKLRTKSKLRAVLRSAPFDSEERLRLYLDAIKLHKKVSEWKHELILLHNEMHQISGHTNFLGLEAYNG